MTASPPRVFSRLVRLRALPYKTDMISLHAAQHTATPLELMECHLEEGARLRCHFFREAAPLLCQAAHSMAVGLAAGGKLLLCGSGGGFLMARQMLALLTGRFQLNRPALPAVVLLPEDSALPVDGQNVLIRQIEALGVAGDVLVIFSPSEPCPALLAAAEAARRREMYVAALSGDQDGNLGAHSDILLRVQHARLPLVQEIHMAAGHLVCRLIDYYLFENPAALQPAAATA